jgi:hypothetical protein
MACLRASYLHGGGWLVMGACPTMEMTFASAVIGDAGSSGNRSFLPDQSAAADRSLPPQASATAKSGRIEIVLAGGHRVIVDNSVDAVALARVLAVLERP